MAKKVYIRLSGYVPVNLPTDFCMDHWESGVLDDEEIRDYIDWNNPSTLNDLEFEAEGIEELTD